ncbi:MAG: S8 family serine peptidase, partial [Streptosporangiaceae bacterium]
TLSSGGTTPVGDVVDLAAPGYLALAVAGINQQPAPALPTEAFGGTSQSAPFISGAAADVIQAYRDSHGQATPTPTQVKEILTSTATDIGAESDQQGAGLVNVFAAVEAARQMPGTSVTHSSTPELVANPSQLDVQGAVGSTVPTSVTLYNASSNTEKVTGTYRALGSETSFGSPVTENVSAPPPGNPIPAQGATAAAPITFTVPKGVSVLDADMRWPDPTNNDNNILSFILTDPAGRLAQSSYDYGASNGGFGPNTSPDIQHATIQHPMAGTWTAQILWANGRGHAQSPPDTPGPYTGTVTFQASGQNFTTSPASPPVTIPARSWAAVPLSIAIPRAPGDAPESVQFTGPNGLVSSVPIARRALIPSGGGSFGATLTSSVSRGWGQVQT